MDLRKRLAQIEAEPAQRKPLVDGNHPLHRIAAQEWRELGAGSFVYCPMPDLARNLLALVGDELEARRVQREAEESARPRLRKPRRRRAPEPAPEVEEPDLPPEAA